MGGAGVLIFLFCPPALADPPGDQSQWIMTFNDEFNGTSLDLSKWATTYPGGYRTNNDELEWYVDDADQHVVSNGTLKLIAKRESVSGHQYTSGMITSYPSFNQTYGYWEGRMKLPKGRGLWPAIWTLPKSNAWPPEIDIMENLGHQPTVVYLTYHWGTSSNHQQSSSSYSGPDFSGGFHTFGIDWNSSGITWYVDGVQRKKVTSSITNSPMYILLNLAVGGSWPGSPDSSTVFPAQLEVDYVRVYAKGVAPPPTNEPPDPPKDLTIPDVSISSPRDGGVVSYFWGFNSQVRASDNSSLASVELFANGKSVGKFYTSRTSYTAYFRVRGRSIPRGNCTLLAEAYDAAGNRAYSKANNILVR